jgi:hypothetical protein
VVNGTSPFHVRLTKVRSRLGGDFGLRLLSDPSLAFRSAHFLGVLLFLEERAGVSSGTLAFAYMFPSPKGHGWTFTS